MPNRKRARTPTRRVQENVDDPLLIFALNFGVEAFPGAPGPDEAAFHWPRLRERVFAEWFERLNTYESPHYAPIPWAAEVLDGFTSPEEYLAARGVK